MKRRHRCGGSAAGPLNQRTLQRKNVTLCPLSQVLRERPAGAGSPGLVLTPTGHLQPVPGAATAYAPLWITGFGAKLWTRSIHIAPFYIFILRHWGEDHHPCFTGEEIETQDCQVAHPCLLSYLVGKPVANSALSRSKKHNPKTAATSTGSPQCECRGLGWGEKCKEMSGHQVGSPSLLSAWHRLFPHGCGGAVPTGHPCLPGFTRILTH